MISAEKVINELNGFPDKHDTLKGLFNTFQRNLQNIESPDFPLRAMKVTNLSDTRSIVKFLDREYELVFSTIITGNAITGSISAFRVLGTERGSYSFKELTSRTFNFESIVSIQPPANHDAIRLTAEDECVTLVLNWIHEEINK